MKRKITKHKTTRLLLAFSACVSTTVSAPLIAEEAPLKLADVVVTASKTGEQSLQEVPVSISVMSEDELQESGANNIEDLTQQTPGLGITRNGSASRIYMRGIGTNLDFIGSDPSVTIHADGVYQSRTTTALDDFLDIERVEVLRGPQGSLYGRNSIGGTINIISKLPEAELKRKVRLELGDEGLHRFSTSMSGALNQSENLLGGISLMKTGHDAYIKNVNTPEAKGLFDDDSIAGKGTLRYLASPDAEVILRADYNNVDKIPRTYKSTGLATDGSVAAPVNKPSDPFEVDFSNYGGFLKQINKGTSVELILALAPDWSVTSLTAYRDLDYRTAEDTDGSHLEVLFTEVAEEQEQFSEELRFNYRSEKLKLVTGLYYLDEDHESDLKINVTLPGGIAASRNFDTSNDTSAYALFSQGTYSFTDKLNATLGLRYSKEKKKYTNDHENIILAIPNFKIAQEESWDAWSPKASIDYTFGDGPMVYSSVSRGFKSGGFNVTASDPEFDPEFVVSYEAGVKQDWLNNALRTNIAVFYYDYTDLQVSDFTEAGVLSITNAADAKIQGIEIETSWMPSYDWMIEFNYAFLDATYKEYLAPGGIDVSNNDLNAAPAHKINTAVQYFQGLNEGTLSYRLEYFWQDKIYFTAFNQDVSSQGAYGLVNARINYTPLDESWEFQIYGENLDDKDYSTSSREFPATGVTKDVNPPRTFGAMLTYNFM